MTTSTSTIKEDVIILDSISYMYYLVLFRKGGKEVTGALINSDTDVNVKTQAYSKQLDLQIKLTNLNA